MSSNKQSRFDSDEPFIDLSSCICYLRFTPAVLATAIESRGIYGPDGVGRFTFFDPKTSDLSRPMAQLEAAADVFLTYGRYDDDAIVALELNRYGWWAGDMPDLDAIANAGARDPFEGEAGRNPRALMLAIGGFLKLLDGSLGYPKHPEYKSDSDLAALMGSLLYPPYMGLSCDNLEKLFPAARLAMDKEAKRKKLKRPAS